MTGSAATITVEFHPPRPLDGEPNFKPNGFHIYRVRCAAGRLVASGSYGPDRYGAEQWARKVASDAGFTVIHFA